MNPAPPTVEQILNSAYRGRGRFIQRGGKWETALKKLAAPGFATQLFPPLLRLSEAQQIPAAAIVLLSSAGPGDAAQAKQLLESARKSLGPLEAKLEAALRGKKKLAELPGRMAQLRVDHVIAWGVGAGSASGGLAEVKTRTALIFDGCVEVVLDVLRMALKRANARRLARFGLDDLLFALTGDRLDDLIPRLRYEIFRRLTNPHAQHYKLERGVSFTFLASPEGVAMRGWAPLRPVLLGSRRTFKLQDGKAFLRGPRDFLKPVPTGSYVIVRALNEFESEVQIMNGANAGDTCALMPHEWAEILAREGDAEFHDRSCTCGTVGCEDRHCITGWADPMRPPEMTLESFLFTAAIGISRRDENNEGEFQRVMLSESFRQSMYYAVLGDDLGV